MKTTKKTQPGKGFVVVPAPSRGRPGLSYDEAIELIEANQASEMAKVRTRIIGMQMHLSTVESFLAEMLSRPTAENAEAIINILKKKQ